jgi:hypothetical protein
MSSNTAKSLIQILLIACIVFAAPAAFAEDGGGNSGPGGGGGNSGPGGGGGDGGGNSGPGGGGGNDGGEGSHSSSGSSARNATERAGVNRYLEALKRHGKVGAVETSGASISVTYTDGWRETVSGNRYRLFDKSGRRVVDRAARQSDLARLRAASH